MEQLIRVQWRKSSHSTGTGGNCVEVARHRPGMAAVRDSKDRRGPQLAFSDRVWSQFVRGIKHGEFDLA
jgi:hypothetical protein